MKTQLSFFSRIKPWQTWGLAVLALLCVGTALFHRTRNLESRTTLQSGKKMGVKFILQSAWWWTEPDRLTKMEVTLDGKKLPLSRSAIGVPIPVKPDQPPIIVEKGGFPEVIALGKEGAAVKQANWSFLNYGLSAREVITGQGKEAVSFPLDRSSLRTAVIADTPEPVASLAQGGEILSMSSGKKPGK